MNRAFVLTPPGGSAIAVIRVVGPGALPFLRTHFSRAISLGRPVHGDLTDGDRVLDDPVVVLVREDVADINLHGGPWVVQSTVDLLAREEFELTDRAAGAEPPGSAPLHDETADAADLVDREVLTHLPMARTELAVRALLAQPAAWRALSADPPSAVQADRVLADKTLIRLLSPPRVAIVGPANVGKSTLANRLFGRDRSITADLPGTTRDWVGELADVSGLAVMLVDTPGMRATDDPIERDAIERASGQVAGADAALVVVDGSRPWDDEQAATAAAYPDAIAVVNKVDRPAAWDVDAILAGRQVVRIAATIGTGTEDVRRTVLTALGCDVSNSTRAMWWSGPTRLLAEAIQGVAVRG